jgi:Ca2+-binding EF-hand superfamily protein
MGALVTDKEIKLLIEKYDDQKVGFISFIDFKSCMGEL